jgi:hypothetical protein
MRRRFELLPISVFFEADSGAGEGGAGNAGSQNTDDDNDGGEGSNDGAASGKTFTQAEIDRIVQREKRKAAEAERKRIEDEAKTAAMSETDKLRSAKDAAEKSALAAVTAANQRLVQADAKVTALELGAKPDRVTAILRLADLSDIEVDDQGVVDAAAVKDAVNAVLADFPEFKASESSSDTNTTTRNTNVGGGSNPAGGGGKVPSLQEQYAAAQKAGNVPLMMSLNRQIFEEQQKSRR